MKFLPFLAFALLAGCQTAAPVQPLPKPAPVAPAQPPAAAPAALPPVATAAPDLRSRQQAQLIEALISQNDALAAQLAARGAGPAAPTAVAAQPPPAPTPAPALPAAASVIPAARVPDDALTPNAEGLIDLASGANAAADAGEPVNPFAVRSAPGQTREVSLLVGGVILGTAPCALVNKRLVQPGDRVEAFLVEQVETGGVVLRFNAHRLRLPVSPQPTRIKFAL
jgi:hypothetical protein